MPQGDDSFVPEPELTYKCRLYLKKQIKKAPGSVSLDYDKERRHILGMMKRTINMGESNSALVIGPRGCGKTTLINMILDKLRRKPSFHDQAVVVELNGLVHTDDRLALKDMTRQMGLDNVVDGKVFGSFPENLTFLLNCLKSGDRTTSKSTIIILDEFDLFCEHRKQTLLYNLFDVSQSAQAPLCVLGLTCRLDVTELLEKRVKSRFSHRQITLFPQAHARSALSKRMELVKRLLSLPSDNEDGACEDGCDIDLVFSRCWNKHIEELLKDQEVINIIEKHFEIQASERALRSFLTVVVSRLTSSHPFLSLYDFVQTYKQFTADAKVNMLKGLSVLEMCLIIAMKHHTDIYDGNPLNFEMVLRMYLKFVSQNSSVNIVDRSVILKAYEHIKNLELIIPVKGCSRHVQKEHQMHHFLPLSEQVNTAVKEYQNLPTEVEQWAFSSLQ
ncbi:origin recognition complex subunit 4 isoform X1 [Anabrus simplex]|uniref:origin recognition complex subunit 4 isoform X1 n=1 Tax=Anabrus simplex TaxID=316456 RepID=UPI0035A27E2F